MNETDNRLPKNAAVDLWIDPPLQLTISQNGELTITCYQQVAGEQNALSMNLKFTADAAGSLISSLYQLVQDGRITLESGSKKQIQ